MTVGRYGVFLLTVTALTLSICAQPSTPASPEEELEATFDNIVQTLRDKNVEGFLSHCHPQAVMLLRDRAFPLDRAAQAFDQWTSLTEDMFASSISLDYVPVDLTYRVVGGTGLVFGFGQFRVDSRIGASSNLTSRLTATFVHTDQGWKLLAWHASAVPTSTGR